MRRTRGGRLVFRIGALVLGTALIALGLALIVLPGPLTIPPVLLGLYVLSTEFAFAERQLDKAQKRGQRVAGGQGAAGAGPFITGGGLVAAGVAVWAATRYELVARGKDLVGL